MRQNIEQIDFYFLLPINRESIVFGSNFRNGDFDGFTVFKTHESENHIFSDCFIFKEG